MTISLYSCGDEGTGKPRLIPFQQPGEDPDLHPDLHPKPGRRIEGPMQVGASCLPGVEVVGAGGPGISPGFTVSGGSHGGPGSDIEAVPEPRLSGKPNAEEKLGFLSDRFR